MRTNLLVNYLEKQNPDFCQSCLRLGYISNSLIDFKNVEKIIDTIKYGNDFEILVHASTTRSQHFVELVRANVHIKVSIVACEKCWLRYSGIEDSYNTAIIFFKPSSLNKLLTKKSKIKLYLFIDHKIDILSFKDISKEDLSHIYLFSKNSLLNHKNEFNYLKTFNFYKALWSNDYNFNYELPFNHDQIDERAPNHLNWIFKPAIKFSSSTNLPTKPVISIIIPFYNRRFFIEKILHSLQNQDIDLSRFEILLIDDGSSDDSESFIIELLSSLTLQVSYFYISRNHKLSNLYIENRVGPIRNLGAQIAKGEILLFLDSDILLPKDYLSNLIQHHSTYEVVMPKRIYLTNLASSREYNANYIFSNKDFMETSWNIFLNVIFKENKWNSEDYPWKYFMTYCISVKKEIFNSVGGFRTNYISYGYEDIDLGYRILKKTNKYLALNENVYHLYHFNLKSEYDLFSFRRYFQLAISSRMFMYQNMPMGKHDLEALMIPRTRTLKIIEYFFTILWKINKRLNKKN